MLVDLREGNREEIDGEVQLGMAGAGLLADGRSPNQPTDARSSKSVSAASRAAP